MLYDEGFSFQCPVGEKPSEAPKQKTFAEDLTIYFYFRPTILAMRYSPLKIPWYMVKLVR